MKISYLLFDYYLSPWLNTSLAYPLVTLHQYNMLDFSKYRDVSIYRDFIPV
jgi:hypothetical protein